MARETLPRRVMRRVARPVTRRRSTEPFVVAYDTSDGFTDGATLTRDQFFHVLEDYDAVIVARNDSRSTTDQYLLYGDALDIELPDDLEQVENRKRSRMIAGEFQWFDHGENLAVDMSIGLRCRDSSLWEELP